MIASLQGKIFQVLENGLIINVGGVGLRVFTPRDVLEKAVTGQIVQLHTHLIVREQELALYGFSGREDLGLFEILLAVNGVGPKVALAMLSTLSPEMLQNAVMREETAVLQRVPGIGKKTAERIMFQLRDKLDFTAVPTTMPLVSDVDADVIDVLTGLGFSIVEAQTALQHVPREAETIDERVGLALQFLGQ